MPPGAISPAPIKPISPDPCRISPRKACNSLSALKAQSIPAYIPAVNQAARAGVIRHGQEILFNSLPRRLVSASCRGVGLPETEGRKSEDGSLGEDGSIVNGQSSITFDGGDERKASSEQPC